MTETWPQCSFHSDGATTFGIKAFSITTLSITIKTRHSSQWNSILLCRVSFMLTVFYAGCRCYASWHYAKCQNAECHGTFWHLKSIKFFEEIWRNFVKTKNSWNQQTLQTSLIGWGQAYDGVFKNHFVYHLGLETCAKYLYVLEY